MLWTEVKTNWNKVQRQFHTKWSKLSDDDLKDIGGKKSELVSKLQKRYSMDKKKAEDEAEAFIKTIH